MNNVQNLHTYRAHNLHTYRAHNLHFQFLWTEYKTIRWKVEGNDWEVYNSSWHHSTLHRIRVALWNNPDVTTSWLETFGTLFTCQKTIQIYMIFLKTQEDIDTILLAILLLLQVMCRRFKFTSWCFTRHSVAMYLYCCSSDDCWQSHAF